MNVLPPTKEKETNVPADLRKVLAASSKATDIWKTLTPLARRDFITWIESAKQPETRKRRVESIPSRLASGKRRPCCYNIVPMNLYKALSEYPKAKATWKDLSPTERRDFVSWIGETRDPESRKLKIVKVCGMLSAGKRRP